MMSLYLAIKLQDPLKAFLAMERATKYSVGTWVGRSSWPIMRRL